MWLGNKEFCLAHSLLSFPSISSKQRCRRTGKNFHPLIVLFKVFDTVWYRFNYSDLIAETWASLVIIIPLAARFHMVSVSNYTVVHTLSRDILLVIFDTFHRPLGWYCSYTHIRRLMIIFWYFAHPDPVQRLSNLGLLYSVIWQWRHLPE